MRTEAKNGALTVESAEGESVPEFSIVGMLAMYKNDLSLIETRVAELASLEQQAHDERLVMAGKAQAVRELIAYHEGK